MFFLELQHFLIQSAQKIFSFLSVIVHNIHKDAFFLPFVMVRDEMSCSFTLTIPAQKDMLETKLESEIHSKDPFKRKEERNYE